MRIKQLRVANLKSIASETLPFRGLTTLVGANGAGKSSFVRALDLFFNPGRKPTPDEVHANADSDILVEVKFTELEPEATAAFLDYLEPSGDLTVLRRFRRSSQWTDGTYHGFRKGHADVTPILRETDKEACLQAYNLLRQKADFAGLPKEGTMKAAKEALGKWTSDKANQSKVTRVEDAGGDLGFPGKTGDLSRFSRLVLIPAVSDPSVATSDAKGTPAGQLFDLLVRDTLAQDEDLTKLVDSFAADYKDQLQTTAQSALTQMELGVRQRLQEIVPQADVRFGWHEVTIKPPSPAGRMELAEDGHWAGVEAAGTGLQRALILALLQALAENRARLDKQKAETPSKTLPDLVLAIEEPEIYQHPSRQRHLFATLIALARRPSEQTTPRIQVLQTTHSPLFLNIDYFDYVVRVTKRGLPGHRKTEIKIGSLENCAARLSEIEGAKVEPNEFRKRLRACLTPRVNEGFFARLVVLVEGESDYATIRAAAEALGENLDSHDVAILPVLGKNNIGKLAIVFTELGIPTFTVWDADKGRFDQRDNAANLNAQTAAANRHNLSAMGQTPQDWPAGIRDNCAVFPVQLEHTLAAEIGDIHAQIFEDVRSSLGIIDSDDMLKSPEAAKLYLENAKAAGRASATLEAIVKAILKMARQEGPPVALIAKAA